MKESLRYIVPILVFVALILSVGTTGYLIIEDDISVSDAFYMAVTAITPTQFDEVHELSVGGRYFTVLLVFCGFGAVVAFATQFARLIIQSELEGVGVITRKQMRRRIQRMKNHYIVCGYGEIGEAICSELHDQRLSFVLIADDEPSVAAVTREGYALVRGNPTADVSLKEAGIESAAGVIAVLSDDADNLFISLAARELNPKILIIAHGKDSSVEDRILRAGADIVVSPMKLGGRQIAGLIKQQAGTRSTTDDPDSPSSVLGVRLAMHHHLEDESTTVKDLLSEIGAISAVGVQQADGTFVASPNGDVGVHRDDMVVFAMRTDDDTESIHPPPSGKTILLADDHRALRLLFTRKLASAGHDVIQAANGNEAIQKAKANSPCLIILDINMPQKNGYEVCKALRKLDQFADVPIILYSGESTDQFVQRGREAGADRCIRKTSKSSDLLTVIDQAFSGRQIIDPPSSANERNERESHPTDARNDSAGEAAFNMDTAMENVGGDSQLAEELFDAVFEETPRLMQQIHDGYARSDFDTVRISAHTLKSSVAILGADATANAANELEDAAHGDDHEAIQHRINELQQNVDRFLSAIESRCSTQAG
ncbi:MAG: response regulator [Pirellulaceae bacterium]|nr:response regulator [Pirellulaceae bacterium]